MARRRIERIEPGAFSGGQLHRRYSAAGQAVVGVLIVGGSAPNKSRQRIGRDGGLPKQGSIAIRIQSDDDSGLGSAEQNPFAVGERLADGRVAEIQIGPLNRGAVLRLGGAVAADQELI